MLARVSAAMGAWAAAPDRLDLTIVERATGEIAGEAVLNEFDAGAGSANFRRFAKPLANREPDDSPRKPEPQHPRTMKKHVAELLGKVHTVLGLLDVSTALYQPDGSHPSADGVRLTAETFRTTLIPLPTRW